MSVNWACRSPCGRGGPTHLPQVGQLPDFRLIGGAILSKVPRDQLLVGEGQALAFAGDSQPEVRKSPGGKGRPRPLRRADVGLTSGQEDPHCRRCAPRDSMLFLLEVPY